MKRPTTSRGSELLINLCLEVTHRRPKANFEWVGVDVELLIHAKVPNGEAISQAGEKYGISESTVKRMYKLYLERKAIEEKDYYLMCPEEKPGYSQSIDKEK